MHTIEPETTFEAIDHLETFFIEDMWYAKGAEWKTEAQMIKYLKSHFKILRKQVKKLEAKNEQRKNSRDND